MGAIATMTAYSQLIAEIVAAIAKANEAGLEQADVSRALTTISEMVEEATEL